MERTILTPQERLEHIVEESYNILCQQIAQGKFTVFNEASMQLQFSVILNAIGQLYKFNREDHFEIELEENIKLDHATNKSQNKQARCDIWLRLFTKNGNEAECAIELKSYKKSSGETTTDNRFKILRDIENLEHYRSQKANLIGYEIVYTDNPNYAKSDTETSSYLKIGNGSICQGTITSNNRTVKLQNEYKLLWDYYPNEKNGSYFLKVKIDN